ncbi:ABC transporter substrate-binding protein [Streptomyces mirabilis]|uniref:ABC transporter substrate-binding protein n=1 Tax=Streptomyces mirabilis TaxID=68239 RepID=UPI0037F2417B
MMRVTRIAIALLVSSTMGLAACSGGGAASSSAPGTLANGKTFTMALAGDPGNLDPSMSVLVPESQMSNLMYDNLLSVNSNGDIQPWLALEWSATTTKANFTLRPGVTCSDGSPLKASDVAADLNFIANPASHSPYLGLLVVPGLKATANDSNGTVNVTSAKPDSFLARNLGSIPIICGKGTRDRSLLARGSDGTGPYVLSKAQPNDQYTLTRRKDYAWRPGAATAIPQGLPDKIVVRIVTNEETAANLLITGQINAATIRGTAQLRLLQQGIQNQSFEQPPGVLVFNESPSNPTTDPAVRKALVEAADLTQVGKVMTNNQGRPSQGVVAMTPRACTGNVLTGNIPSYNAAAANSTLDAAGWTLAAQGFRYKNGKRLTLKFSYPSGITEIAAGVELLQQEWKKIGADVSLEGLDTAGLGRVLQGAVPWDVGLAPFQFNLPSNLVPFVSGPTPPAGINFPHVENADYQNLVNQAQTLTDKASCPKWNAAETSLIKRVDIVPLMNSIAGVFVNKAAIQLDRGLILGTSIRMHSK